MRAQLVGLALFPSVPPYNGGSNRVFNLARGLSERFDVAYFAEALRLCALRPGGYDRRESATYREYVALSLPSAVSQMASRFMRVPQLGHAFAMRLGAQRALRTSVRSADIVVVTQPWLYAWARRNAASGAIVVYDAQNVEADMFDRARIRPRFLRHRLAETLVRQERRAASQADLVFVTSHDDERQMIERYGTARTSIAVVPNGVDLEHFREIAHEERSDARRRLGVADRHVAVFVGSQHGPNIEAVREILALAATLSQASDLLFLIAGGVAKSFPNAGGPNVRFTGFVDDTRSVLAAADVLINPMSSGSGTNLKQIEYLACAIPSVASPFGARGLGIVHETHALVVEPSATLGAIDRLRADDELARSLARAGRRLAEERFGWSQIANRFAERLTLALCERRGATHLDAIATPPREA